MKCIVGLGNPGRKYKQTRHNIGFWVIEEVAKRNGWTLNKQKFQGEYTLEIVNQEKIILLEPLTYMNLSGESVRPLMDFYELAPEDILVIYDDLDLPTGKIRLRQKGGHGGHNGIRSIIDQLGSKSFNRLRIGIDRPAPHMTVTDHVLGKFDKEQLPMIEEAVDQAANACEAWMSQPFLEVMNEYNK
ncbi:PTH1 family peptidyl-tRNA hydrolase [Natronobacillus azotifigens]|uniref:Peptidyl-tRNA hydrolase n=1 Tax=Natronobacillus azotifigens TaxID=472978 RepID=A0A9J6RE40_9BACI|nr:aminoacyl-tRNA hydrolase [Natronobacillus azotifigens]MCZ0703603.1 aminoacyl-tRNA hydrolase [Natronobacillus azotifigens]